MAASINVSISTTELRELLATGTTAAIRRAMRKAGSTALRDMRSEASKRVRKRKRIRAQIVHRSLVREARGRQLEDMEWALRVRNERVPLSAYPHRQVKKGVSVEVDRGVRKIVRSAFVATMESGHKGIWVRRGARSLPVRELLGSRPHDELLHDDGAEAVAARGARSLRDTFARLLPEEVAKEKAKAAG